MSDPCQPFSPPVLSLFPLFLIVEPRIQIELQSSSPLQRMKPSQHSKLGNRISSILSPLQASFAPFLADNFRWQKKSSSAASRGLEHDGEDVPASRRRTAFQTNLHLALMLGQIANFFLVISRSIIVKNSISINSIW